MIVIKAASSVLLLSQQPFLIVCAHFLPLHLRIPSLLPLLALLNLQPDRS